ncbi:hypothetical protein [Streptomyces sp. SID3343]|uniref:hypothetical protein n=1 Tax=Streptomyces sp. SID3343 TaxID=2690260 RepID=UPI00136B4982|nr:hypothetical protein [Streptomyces sp. SID3343]MYV99176.1 hypothetical protein [Streptomyces sp. SID3343]
MIIAVGVLPESDLRSVVDLLVSLVETTGACVIFAGALIAFVRFLVLGLRERTPEVFTKTPTVARGSA